MARANLFLLECLVARVVGATTYRGLAQDFLDQDPQGLAAETVGRRLDSVLGAATTPGGGRRS